MKNLKFSLLAVLVFFLTSLKIFGQSCPPNLNFSSGYTGWTYYSGQCSDVSGVYTYTWIASGSTPPPASGSISYLPTETQIVDMSTTILSGGTFGSGIISSGYDIFGAFPVAPPAMPSYGFPSSAHSLLLNGTIAGTSAAMAEYTFTPSAYGVTSLAYEYAVVLQDPLTPAHTLSEMPRFNVVATDISTGGIIGCVDFTFVAGVFAGSPVPFTHSSVTSADGYDDVYYLPWQPGSIDLSSVPAGHAIKIDFMVGGCTPSGHWGYAYIDMACIPWPTAISGCYPGNVTLPIPPPGYETYNWYQGGTLIATGSTPPTISTPPTATTYTLTMDPYLGFGCAATLSVTVNPLPTPVITGVLGVCQGLTVQLSSTVSGGTWSSSNTSVATIGSTTGIVSGVTTGNSIITNTSSYGCIGTSTVTVNPLPTITGTLTICLSTTSILSSGTTGGTWTSSNTSIATIGSSSGIVNPIGVGSSVITCTSPFGCITTTTVTVISSVPAITGPSAICVGSAIVMSDSAPGGDWTSSNTTIAIVDPSGNVTGVSPGIAIISYSFGSVGCFSTTSVTVTPVPPAITGPGTVCIGSTISLSDAVGGGTWTSNIPSFATINSTTGVVTGISTGTVNISYSVSGYACPTTHYVNIYPNPSITGVNTVCDGGTITLSTSVLGAFGGVWSSSNTAVATVSASGIVNSVSTGTVTITYTTSYTACSGNENITINPTPGPITVPSSMCQGSAITLSDAISGGTWTSSNTSIATIDPVTGMLTGVSAGTASITYTLSGGCFKTNTVTVLALPGTVTGTDYLCVGNTTTLSDAVGSGFWSSNNTSVAGIGSSTGIVTGVSGGTAIITYSLIDGCGASTATVTVMVNPLPDAITGNTVVCAGSTTILSDLTPDGTWSSNNTSIATIVLGTGVAGGVSEGTTPITYILGTGCYITTSVTVNPTPTITGPVNVCVNSEISLSDDITGGTWASSNTTVAIIGSGTGIVTGVSAGTTVITYTLATGCFATTTVTVNPLPDLIIGSTPVCAGSTIALADGTSGGTWSSSNTLVATIDGFGVVTGVAGGAVTITYTLGTGCIATTTVVVNPDLPIIGTTSVCAGSTISLTDGVIGGVWSSSNTDIAIVTVDPITFIVSVTGITTGTVTITYTTPAGCIAITTVTVNPTPGLISGATTEVCIGANITLSDGLSGGVWTSSNTAVATVDNSTGIVTGVATGSANITYTVGDCFATYSVTVDQPLLVDIGGPGIIFQGCPVDISGYVNPIGSPATVMWSSSNTSVATVSPGPVYSYTTTVTGGVVGTSVITFSATNACGTATFAVTVDVEPLPIVTIGGPATICAGSDIVLSSDPGTGTWASSLTTVATVNLVTGDVTGVNPGGTTILTYTLDLYASCVLTATTTVTVYPQPGSITGLSAICIGDGSFTLSDDLPGGTWSSSNSVILIGSTSGVVTALAPGGALITYTTAGGCYSTVVINVYPLPPGILGSASVCLGSTITLSDYVSGGTWTSSNTAVATIGSGTGVVTSVSVGATVITYQVATGCITTSTVTVVEPETVADISGGHDVCAGTTLILSDSPAGGVWTSDNTSVATIDPVTGIVTGIVAGTTNITYTFTNACGTWSIPSPVTVHTSTPLPITGITDICLGSTTILSNGTSGGIWSSSSSSVATIDPVTGVVTSTSAGTTTISYISTNAGGCVTTATVIVTVNPLPANITGALIVCIGSTISLSDGTAGGTWFSNNTIIATIDGSGTVTGNSGGVVTISYTLPTGCMATYIVTVLGPPVPGGVIAICAGTTTTISNIVGGGTWSSSNTAIATVDATGVITGVATGIATVTYIASGVCGTFSVTATVSVNMPPYITTNFMIACQSLGDHHEFTHILNDSAGCIDVCENRVIRYYGNGVIGSVFSWAVSGGTIVHNYGDSIDVLWPTAGTTCSISLYDMAGDCSGATTVCLRIIAGPHAAFSASEISICLNGSVSFTDLSTADPLSPINSWYWNFGDGGYSSLPSPVHMFTTANSNDTVTLAVRNYCGCTDTFRMVLNIMHNPGPTITCPSIVCDHETTTYSISDTSCEGSIEWSVSGGTIVSGAGTTSITVHWNHVNPSGYGYVNVADPCSVCSDTTTIKIPVILATDTITGPDIVCTGNQYEYSLPLWPATQYMWGVLGDPGAVTGYHDDYHVILNFSTPGIYFLHGWYQNTIKLCGANLYKTIIVYPTTHISGPTIVCAGTTPTYTVGGLNAHWVISDASSGTVLLTHTGTSFSYASPPIGTYVINATGHFCIDPIIVSVVPTGVSVDSLKGPDTVCLGRVYQYIGYGISPLSWHATGGTVSVSSGCDTVNVIWTSSGPKQLTVSSSVTCGTSSITMNIQQEIINPVITGNTTPCANSHQAYSTAYTRAEVYDWSIYPTTAGSVVSGDHTTGINVLWNNVTGTSLLSAGVILTVHKCDSIIKDTLQLSVLSPTVTLASSINPACPEAIVTYTATAGGISYGWNFGDGTTTTTTVNTVTHTFPSNTTPSNVNYVVTVTVMPDVSYPCPAAGVCTLTEVIMPGPLANPSFVTNLCGGPTLILGEVTDIGGTFTYQWYDGGTPISGATDVNYTATTVGEYTILVTSGDGCSSQGSVFVDSCSPPGCGTVISATATTTGCNQITVSATSAGGTSPVWVAYTWPVIGPMTVTGVLSTTFTYDVPGFYHFQYRETMPDGCVNQANVSGEIDVSPRFTYNVSCGSGIMDNLTLTDNSAYLSGWSVTGIVWSDLSAMVTGTTTPLTLSLPPNIYYVTETVTFTSTTTATFTCSTTQTITLPAHPASTAADFTYTLSPICEAIPITFTPTTPGAYSYSWDFGDGASSLLQNTQRTYTWDPALAVNPQFYPVTLTITDGSGCTVSASHTMQIQLNLVNGYLGGNQVVCSPDAPVTLAYTPASGSMLPIISYLWSTSAITPTISVGTSGAYWVTVVGPYQCQATVVFPATEITIVHMPPVHITGNLSYCYGDVVQLSGDVGTGVAYQWYLDSGDDGITATVADGGLAAGDHTYQLVISAIDSLTSLVMCSETASVTVHIYDMPPTPVITGPLVIDCNSYHLQLTAFEPLPGFYNWSDGNIGATDDIYAGGYYEVWFTSLGGCKSNATIYVSRDPELSLQYFPTGCYDICRQQLPLTLYGPPDEPFTGWEWLHNGSPVMSGSGLMSKYTIPAAASSSGLYQWDLYNGLCKKRSDTMGVTIEDCSDCKASLTASMKCDFLNPACFFVKVGLFSLVAGTTYTVGTNIGPVLPFSGTLPGVGSYIVNLTFTTLEVPAPSTVEVEVSYEVPGGGKCFQTVTVKVPSCTWIAERTADSSSATSAPVPDLNVITNALLVFPNPASGDMTISYDYGADVYSQRSLEVYDMMGRKIQSTVPGSVRGNWMMNITDWTPGIYIVRMEGDSKTLQTQRVVVSH